MIFSLWEIFIPLLLTFLLGLLLGWLIWRWRRTSVTANQWNELSASGRKAETELATVVAARDEAINERSALSSRVASLTTDHEAVSANLESSNVELATLRGDLNTANGQVGTLQGDLAKSNDAAAKAQADLKAQADAAKKAQADLKAQADATKKAQADLKAQADATKKAQAELDALRGQVKDKDAKINALGSDVSGKDSRIKELAAGAAAAALVATQLDDSKARSGELEASLGAARGELDGAQGRIADLEAQLGTEKDTVGARDARIAELEGELGGALAAQRDLDAEKARAADLEAQLAAAQGLQGDLDAKDARIAELEAALDGPDEDQTFGDENAMRMAAWESGAWKVGETQLGTPGVEVDHVDDLKVIKGVGPKLEGVLNGFGVQTWEQVAAFTDEDQATVNDALDSFPGRIYRDEWVPQAQAIMANGHMPLTKKKKADLDSANARIEELETELADESGAQEQVNAIRGDLDGANARAADLEAQLAAAQGLQGDLDGANARAADLEAQLAAAQGLQGDLDARNARIAELQSELGDTQGLQGDLDNANARIAELQSELGDTQGLQGDLDGANARVAQLEAEVEASQGLKGDLDGANNRVGELEAELAAAGAAGAEVGQLRVSLTEKDRRIEALENAARNAASSDDLAEAKRTIKAREARIAELEASIPPETRYYNAWKAGAWHSGKTKLGTPGIDHSDDLKVISGIGPQMEGLLNGFGIKSWEQLADLTKDEVATVDGALEEFPGRIERDEWVPQAKAIMENGHKPVARAPKKRVKKKPSWQKGTTKLGTPGAAHKDDLKVVNGIGPKMEGILNSFGIQTWEQLGAFKKADVEKVTEAINTFPGRIERDEWVSQAKDLCKQFKDVKNRPTRETYLNNSGDTDPFS